MCPKTFSLNGILMTPLQDFDLLSVSLWCTHQVHCLPSSYARDRDHQGACTLALRGPAQGSTGRWKTHPTLIGLYPDPRTDLPLRVNSVLRPQQHRGQDREELQAHVRVCGGLETSPEGRNHVLQCFSHSWAWKKRERTTASCWRARLL